MSIIYVITVLILYVLFILTYKTQKKQNVLEWLAISMIVMICYNILICLMCTLLGVMCTLKNLSICNMFFIGILASILLKKKRIQKYYFKISDLVYSIIVLILVVFIGYKQYGIPFNIKYEITDGSSHYHFAQQFYKNETLLYNETTDDYLGIYQSDFRLPGAYVNEGILFKVFEKNLHPVEVFIIFDLFILYMSGILFYYLLKTALKENKKNKLLAVIFSIMYMLGYQLNSMLMGYVYLSLALNIIVCFILLIVNYKNQEMELQKILPILSLISFGIFFSYAYFVPVLYIAIIANIIIKAKVNKEKIFSIDNILQILYLIIIPLILGVFYFIIFPVLNGEKTEISTIGTNGMIYENFITNYLGLIPIYIMGILVLKKKEMPKNNFSSILLISSIIYSTILFIGYKLEIVSRYYFFKSYYLIWILFIYNAYIILNVLLDGENKKIKRGIYIYLCTLVMIVISSNFIWKINIGINDIFYENQSIVSNENVLFKSGELEIVKKIENIFDFSDIYVLSSSIEGRMRWMSVLHYNQYIYIEGMMVQPVTIDKWLAEKETKYYLAYYDDYNLLKEEERTLNPDSRDYKIIHDNEYGFILEKIEE